MSRPISTENVFRALSHVTRRSIIEVLLKRPATAGELASHFKHSRPVLSRHLRILQGVHLIAFERKGTSLMYRLVPGAFSSLHQWVAKLPKSSRDSNS